MPSLPAIWRSAGHCLFGYSTSVPSSANLVNGCTTPAGRGLIGALAHFGMDVIGTQHKDAMRKRIMEGWPFTPEEREQIVTYCAEDVAALEQLLTKLLPSIDLGVAALQGRVCRRVRGHGASRRADRHGDLPATGGQGDLGGAA